MNKFAPCEKPSRMSLAWVWSRITRLNDTLGGEAAANGRKRTGRFRGDSAKSGPSFSRPSTAIFDPEVDMLAGPNEFHRTWKVVSTPYGGHEASLRRANAVGGRSQ